MAEGTDEGVSYLRALKQSSGPPEGTAAATALETGSDKHPPEGTAATAGERFQGSEKRRSMRYKCEGSAGMREEGCDVHTWASFTDVSLHGCYVEAQATSPVGTILHLKLDANGVRVESKGAVRVSYPYLGMGIAFVEVSEETRERLKEMLGTVTRPTGIMGPGIASSLPARGPLEAAPVTSDPAAALRALTEFFESRQMLMREDFLRILRRSQGTEKTP